MSDKVTVDGLTTWHYPRYTVSRSVALAMVGVVFAGVGIYALSTGLFGPGTKGILISIFFILCGLSVVIAISSEVGSLEIVFDDNTESIYLNEWLDLRGGDINEWWKAAPLLREQAAPLLREQADSELSGVPIPCLC